ncbi:zinc finger BED domain-containing protein 4-like [Aphis gossypii]|uniref:zinc finger BED domain-containing protein 4-like n=1 Tax=Aphis gossypii TaxID=80765 RepID=UPI002158B7B2|nr:zinc finger BED domain-containing protein 4-like [Aphis gossypii]
MYTGELSKHHTSENLKETLLEVMENWNVDGKVSGITHDNAFNITKAIKRIRENINEGCRSMPCAVHTLQLAVNKGLGIDECMVISKKASAIVSAFKHSYKRTTALESHLINNGKPKLRLIQCCPTRWNSTLHMFERLIEVRSAIVAVMADQLYFTKKMAKKLEFFEDDWEKCRNLISLLKPLELATTVLFADKKVTISIVRPIISSLLSNKFKINTSDNELTVKFKSIVSNELCERFGFDPRHKNLNHETSDNVKQHIRQTVKSLIQSYEETSEKDQDQITKNTTAMDILLGKADISYNEFEQYITEIQINHNLDPCIWWKEHETIQGVPRRSDK